MGVPPTPLRPLRCGPLSHSYFQLVNHGSGYMGLAATTWVSIDAQIPVFSTMGKGQKRGRRFATRAQRRVLAVGKAVVGEVLGVTKRLEGSPGRLKAGGTDLTGTLKMGGGVTFQSSSGAYLGSGIAERDGMEWGI